MTTFDDLDVFVPEEGWPVQRLRMGWALVLFFCFETLIGKSLPQIMPILALGIGVVLLASAMVAIREWKLQAAIARRVSSIDLR